jgi:hypothetical protein
MRWPCSRRAHVHPEVLAVPPELPARAHAGSGKPTRMQWTLGAQGGVLEWPRNRTLGGISGDLAASQPFVEALERELDLPSTVRPALKRCIASTVVEDAQGRSVDAEYPVVGEVYTLCFGQFVVLVAAQ